MSLADLIREGEGIFEKRHYHSDAAFFLAKTLQVLEKLSEDQRNPTPVVLAANGLHKKLINYTPALVWEVPELIVEIDKHLQKIIELMDEMGPTQKED